MNAKQAALSLDAPKDPVSDAEAHAYYDIILFKQRLKDTDQLTWRDYLRTVWTILLPATLGIACIALANSTLAAGSANHRSFIAEMLGMMGKNVALPCLMLGFAALNLFEMHRLRAREREAILVKCVQALISEAMARGAKLDLGASFDRP